jgi:Dolichyl-phosphate-mannose-protein mannosyltransferase
MRMDQEPLAPPDRRRLVVHLFVLAGLVALLLGWHATRAEVLFADGLRYIAQAKAIERGSSDEGLKRAVDHPVYPTEVALIRRALGGDSPEAWQAAAQVASVIAAILLIAPLALVVRELFGPATVLPACILVYLVPLTGHVFADTLSESTFLLFWMWGLWGAIRFLKDGELRWLPLVVVASALAFLTRPEGLLLPAALVVALMLSPRWVLGRLRGSRTLAGAAVLMVGLACLVGPYIAIKGGLTSKPSVARLLGTAPSSSAHAVERQRPLAENQSTAKTWCLAGQAVFKAFIGAVTPPLALLALVGLVWLRLDSAPARPWRLMGVIAFASVIALGRVHATGGYCSPRHAMVLAMVAIPASAYGVRRMLDLAATHLGARVRPIGWGVAFSGMIVGFGPTVIAPLNEGLGGYREAGRWLAQHAEDGTRVVDVTGWSQFYGDRPRDYTFENLVAAGSDPRARWVVVREAHLRGPWEYCERLRELVAGRNPVQVFLGASGRRSTKVLIFDRQESLAVRAPWPGSAVPR